MIEVLNQYSKHIGIGGTHDAQNYSWLQLKEQEFRRNKR